MADFEFVSIPHAIKGAVFFMGTFNYAGLISTEDDTDGMVRSHHVCHYYSYLKMQ